METHTPLRIARLREFVGATTRLVERAAGEAVVLEEGCRLASGYSNRVAPNLWWTNEDKH